MSMSRSETPPSSKRRRNVLAEVKDPNNVVNIGDAKRNSDDSAKPSQESQNKVFDGMTDFMNPKITPFGNMKIQFPESEHHKFWSFSPKTSKLYVARLRPFRVICSDLHVKEYVGSRFLRVMLVYGCPQLYEVPVEICQIHGRDSINESNDSISRQIVNCHDIEGVNYFRLQNRTGFLVPLTSSNQLRIELQISLNCLNTCIRGSYLWRNWRLLFILESENGLVMGRQSVAIKVCAAPKRERRVEESTSADQNEASNEASFTLIADSKEDFEILKAVRKELKNSPLLKSILYSKIKS